MDVFVGVELGVAIALLVAIVYELRALRRAFDSLRVMASDAIGIPAAPDLIERTVSHDAGTVAIPSTLADLLHDYDEEQEPEEQEAEPE
jgi:hypothetical protein